MAITLNEMLNRLSEAKDMYLLVCGEAVIFDRARTMTYVPNSNFDSAVMNPLADFKTMLGHALLWSQQEVVDCTSSQLMEALQQAGYHLEEQQERVHGWSARLAR